MTRARLRDLARRITQIRATDESSLNLYPMMDLMLIVLVFLMATWATAFADVEESAELDIPESTSALAHEGALAVSITRSAILVEGERVVDLNDGALDASDIGANGFLVRDLFEVARDHREAETLVDAANQETSAGTAQLIGDRRTPFRTIAAAMYTLGQAEYPNVRFVVQNQSR
jgi:biopolymer transport protein ExbD